MVSIDRVLNEIRQGKDWLQEWAQGPALKPMFHSTEDPMVFSEFKKIAAWVEQQERLTKAAKEEFFNGADGWLIAYAMAKGRTVVTYEESAPKSKKEVKIPDICAALDVKCCHPYDMLRKLKIKFQYDPAKP